ncbi:MAG: ABC transporter permease [Planctomycetota bacterium]|nr:ABC transporter permease [Planctomycetota bacterium]
MNYFQLVLKQMRQRALSTWLTTLSVMLGVGLAIAIIVLGRESGELFGQNDYGYDLIVGKKGSPLQLTLNTVYHLDVSPGNIPFSEYGRLLPGGDLNKYVEIAVPTVVGDTYQGIYRIVGTTPKYFGYDDKGEHLPAAQVMDYRPGKHLEIADGHIYAPNKFEAVIGSDVARLTNLKVGVTFQATHGIPAPGTKPDIHPETWTVVGVLAPTHTAIDRVLYIPLNSFYTIAEHGVGLIAQEKLREGELPGAAEADEPDVVPAIDASGIQHFKNYDYDTKKKTLNITLSPEVWALSAILVQSRGGVTSQALIYDLNNGTDVMAVNPASVMRDFFETFLKPMRLLLLLICSLVTIVAAVGILVSIYNSVSARLKEIAILRALGATRTTVLTLICLEAGLIAVIGSVLGLALGHAVSGMGSWYMERTFGESLNWLYCDWREIVYVIGVIVLANLAGLVPAMKAYRTSVAANLVAS